MGDATEDRRPMPIRTSLRLLLGMNLARFVWPPKLAGWLSCVVIYGLRAGRHQYKTGDPGPEYWLRHGRPDRARRFPDA